MTWTSWTRCEILLPLLLRLLITSLMLMLGSALDLVPGTLSLWFLALLLLLLRLTCLGLLLVSTLLVIITFSTEHRLEYFAKTNCSSFSRLCMSVPGLPPGFLAGSASAGADPPQLPIFQQGMGIGLSGAALGPFHLGSLGQALPGAHTQLVSGQALSAALPLGHIGVAPPGQPPLVGVPVGGVGALDMGSVAVILGQLSKDNHLLKKAKRERDITTEVALYTNPMSKRAVEHNMRMSDVLSDLVASLSCGGQVLMASSTNMVQVNGAISLVLSAVQVLHDRLAADGEKHLIARTSDYGWKLVSSMEGLEGQVGRISMTASRSQEKAYLAHQAAVDSVNKPSYSGGGGGKF